MNTTTLRGVFPDPKPVNRKNFLRENIRNIKEMQGILQTIKGSHNPPNKPSKFSNVPAKVITNLKKSRSTGSVVFTPKSKLIRVKSLDDKPKIVSTGVQTERPDDLAKLYESGIVKYPSATGKTRASAVLDRGIRRKEKVSPGQQDKPSVGRLEKPEKSPPGCRQDKPSPPARQEPISPGRQDKPLLVRVDKLAPDQLMRISPLGQERTSPNRLLRLSPERGDTSENSKNLPAMDERPSWDRNCTQQNKSNNNAGEEPSREHHNGAEEKRNYIKENIRNIKLKLKKIDDHSDPTQLPSNYQKGEVPKYMKERKEELKQIDTSEHYPGLVLLPEDERKEYLRVARQNYADLIKELNSMPVRNDTLKRRTRKIEIEEELKKIDEVIKVFQKPKVFVKADG